MKKNILKPKRETISSVKKKAWNACSLYVRLSETDSYGYGSCVTCGRTYFYKELQAGHFLPGRTNAILFDLRGIHIQCYGCNIGAYGRSLQYFLWMEKHYGRQVIDELIQLRKITKQFTIKELTEIKDDFQRRVSHLAIKIME